MIKGRSNKCTNCSDDLFKDYFKKAHDKPVRWHVPFPSGWSVASFIMVNVMVLCQKYGCKIREVDLSKRMIDLDCPDETRDAATLELSRLMAGFECE